MNYSQHYTLTIFCIEKWPANLRPAAHSAKTRQLRHFQWLSTLDLREAPAHIPGKWRPLEQLKRSQYYVRLLHYYLKQKYIFYTHYVELQHGKIPVVWRVTKNATVQMIVRITAPPAAIIFDPNGLVAIIVVVVVVARLPIAIAAQPIMNLKSFQHSLLAACVF